MIQHPVLLTAALAAIVAGLKVLSRRSPWDRLFNVFPVPFWCYMLPMLLTAAGVFPGKSPAYGFFSTWVLPFCLAWLLLGVDVLALRGIGGLAAKLMAAGTVGMVGGTVLAAFLLGGHLPEGSWKSLGALAATWTGGSANMLAVKEALAIPDDVFAPVVVTDGLFAYVWMTLLVTAAGWQRAFDGWSGAPAASTENAPAAKSAGRPWSFFLLLSVGAAGAALCVLVSGRLPALGGVFTPASWSVLLTTTAALAAAVWLSRQGRPVPEGLEKTGSFVLLILMAALGARASLTAVVRTPLFLAAGAVVLAAHAAALLAAVRFFRAPLSLAATASQACLGGVISAPMVGAVYSPALAAVGLLLAVAANAVGTYIGLASAALCRWVMTL